MTTQPVSLCIVQIGLTDSVTYNILSSVRVYIGKPGYPPTLGKTAHTVARHLFPALSLSSPHDLLDELHQLLVVVKVLALPEVLVPLAAPQVVLVLAHLEPAGLAK